VHLPFGGMLSYTFSKIIICLLLLYIYFSVFYVFVIIDVFLQVRCLDFIDFSPIQIPLTLPRIKVWKGNLIKLFSDMYIGANGKYGAYPVSCILFTCFFHLLLFFDLEFLFELDFF
jgi:hypothetical protein